MVKQTNKHSIANDERVVIYFVVFIEKKKWKVWKKTPLRCISQNIEFCKLHKYTWCNSSERLVEKKRKQMIGMSYLVGGYVVQTLFLNQRPVFCQIAKINRIKALDLIVHSWQMRFSAISSRLFCMRQRERVAYFFILFTRIVGEWLCTCVVLTIYSMYIV